MRNLLLGILFSINIVAGPTFTVTPVFDLGGLGGSTDAGASINPDGRSSDLGGSPLFECGRGLGEVQ
jgi:hypothetical protein